MAAGALVAVVGPSGAGKDTLIRIAQERFAGEDRVIFPRRIVTRPTGAWEDHDSLDPEAFAAADAAGLFAMTWTAHGLHYGIPAATLALVRDGSIVVANLSRAVVGPARDRFDRVVSVYVTAPPEILAARIVARGREEALAERVARATALAPGGDYDVVIENAGPVEAAAGRLVDVVAGAMALGPAGW
jgi:ribose 1,5-bisphosphokinase